MNNVVSLNRTVPAARQSDVEILAHNLNSPLMFKAFERPLWYEGKTHTRFEVGTHKALVRMVDDKPSVLNVVRDTYKVVQNDELFGAIEKGLAAGISDYELAGAQIKDQLSYNGRTCMRQYLFSGVAFEGPEKQSINFRVIAVNGFGGSAIKLYVGAIDMFCTNGMILGDYMSEYAKHTSGVAMPKFTDTVRMAVDIFWKKRTLWADLRTRVIKSDDTVHAYLKEEFGERLGLKLFHQYLIEQRVRGGNNLWALYSAMTYYASHNTGDFTTRSTKNDHEAETMLKREASIRNVLFSDAFNKLAA